MNDFPVWPHFEQDEIDLVIDVLRSGKTNTWVGEHVAKFENEFANYINMPFALAVANGTLALELALLCLDIQPGDEVIVPSKSYVATASAVAIRGAKPIFADIELDTHNISLDSIKKSVTEKTKAIIVVHIAGTPCEMDSIVEFVRENNLYLIEDCAQAHGAEYKSKKVGSFGDASAFSFCQDKIISTGGEGGMLLLKDESLWRRAWSYRDHGKDYDIMKSANKINGFPWPHTSIGSNWRITEMQAAIGRLQLKKLPEMLLRRRENAEYFLNKISKISGVIVPQFPDAIKNSFYRTYVCLDVEKMKDKWDRNRVINEINEIGLVCNIGSCNAIYKEKAFGSDNYHIESFPNASWIEPRVISFLSHHRLNKKHMDRIAEHFSNVMKNSLK